MLLFARANAKRMLRRWRNSYGVDVDSVQRPIVPPDESKWTRFSDEQDGKAIRTTLADTPTTAGPFALIAVMKSEVGVQQADNGFVIVLSKMDLRQIEPGQDAFQKRSPACEKMSTWMLVDVVFSARSGR